MGLFLSLLGQVTSNSGQLAELKVAGSLHTYDVFLHVENCLSNCHEINVEFYQDLHYISSSIKHTFQYAVHLDHVGIMEPVVLLLTM